MYMPYSVVKSIISSLIALAVALQPIQYSFAQTIDHISPEQVSADGHMTPDTDHFARSVVSDALFFAFALYTYRAVVLGSCDMERLFEGLRSLPYWKDFSYKQSLASDFVHVEGDILTIRFRDGGAVRVFPVAAHALSPDGAISDGIVPKHHSVTEEHVIQYVTAESMIAAGLKLYNDGTRRTGNMSHPALESPPDAVPYKDAGQAMIGFGPALNHSSLDISAEYKGIYITSLMQQVTISGDKVDKPLLVCGVDDKAPEGSRKMAEMLNQVLQVVFNQHFGTPAHRSSNEYMPYVTTLIDDMKIKMLDRRLDVEISSNLNANSARYYGAVVFNKEFIEALYHNWYLNRVETSRDNWELEMGALWMVAERLFHEIGHDPDEAEQIYKDHLFFKAGIDGAKFFQNAVRRDATGRIEREGSQRSTVFGKLFGSDEYFAMIHRLGKIPDDEKARKIKVIKDHLERTYRVNSGKDSLRLPREKEALAAAILSERGITGDIYGESIFGRPLGEFLRTHCLFDNVPPCDDPDVERQRNLWARRLRARPVGEIKSILLSVARGTGEEERVAQWIERRLSSGNGSGEKSDRIKLYPIVQWASVVSRPQNYQLSNGRLFGSIYYEGLNLLTIPIFPLDKDGSIDWELFKWAYAPQTSHHSERGPPAAYFKAKKTSLYEYVLGDPVSPASRPASSARSSSDPQAPERPEHPEGLPSFDQTGEQDAVKVRRDVGAGSALENIETIHEIVKNIDVSSTVDKVTYILIDSDIPAPSQGTIVTFLNRHSRERFAAEKISIMDSGDMVNYISKNGCGRENTVVILSDKDKIGTVGGDVNMLVTRKTGVTDFVNIEALVGAGRSMLSRDWDSFKAIYEALTGDECPDIQEAWLRDPAEFAGRIIFVIPAVSIVDPAEQTGLNDRLKRTLVAA